MTVKNSIESREVTNYWTTRWTQWYNVDSPSYEGDYECLECIKNNGFRICSHSSIMSAECRVVDTGEIFTESDVTKLRYPNILRQPCTKNGLICNNSDQINGQRCLDYAIRFQCASAYNMFGTMYWWIGISTAVFVIVAIMWLIYYIVKRRRDSTDDADNNPELQQPPPTYKDLFGSNSPSPSMGLSRNQGSISSQNPLLNEDSQDDSSVTSPVFAVEHEIPKCVSAALDQNNSNSNTNLATFSSDENHIDAESTEAVGTAPNAPDKEKQRNKIKVICSNNIEVNFIPPTSGSPPPPFMPWFQTLNLKGTSIPSSKANHNENATAPPSYKEALKYLQITLKK